MARLAHSFQLRRYRNGITGLARVKMQQQIDALHAQGMSYRAIGRVLGLHQTVVLNIKNGL
jgi:IS30 family transposase